MMVIKCELGLSVWIWSTEENIKLPELTIKLSNRLYAKAHINGELKTINEPTLPRYKSYFAANSISYTITNLKENDYPSSQDFNELTAQLGHDILSIHNRTVNVLRGRLKGWQLSPIESPKDFRTYLTGWKTQYRHGARGRFSTYQFSTGGGLRGWLEAYQSHNFPQSLHFDRPQIEDIAEWLEENKSITVTEQLLVQALEAEQSNNLRLAILNYMTALEQKLSEYLSIKLNQKLGEALKDKIKDFLRSDNTKFEDRVFVILPLVIHESWLRDIDMLKIKTAIEARNKIAHGETVSVTDRYAQTDWKSVFSNIRSLIEALTNASILAEASSEIKEMAKEIQKTYNLYPTIWVHSQHRVSSDIILYSGDKRDENTLMMMAANLSNIRKEQDDRFQAERHLTIDFYEFPKKHFARWKANEITFTNK